MAEVSIIVPVYNVKEYINKCIDSILDQTYRDIEVILVDDGSPDECGHICDEYAEKDSRVQVIHKENGGLSDARNVGFSEASGSFILFIDSDDYIEKDMVEYLYTNIVAFETDIATCGTYDVYEDHIESNKVEEDFVCSGEAAFAFILRGEKIRGEIWNKLIRRKVIEDIQFPQGKLYEDIFFTSDMMRNVKNVCVGTQPKYYYLHRCGSITGKPYRPQLHDIIEAYTKNLKVVKKYFPHLEKEAECLWIWSRFVVLDKMLLEKKYRKIEGCLETKKFLNRYCFKIIQNPFFKNSRKVSAVILLFSLRLYRRLVIYSVKGCTWIKE